jgi:NADH-quinone oxidoreductase subunit J
METIIIFCLIIMLLGGIAAVMLRSRLKSALALAVSSVMLTIVLYLMNAKWAALFELSVCAGLITVIFVSTVSVSKEDRNDSEHRELNKKRNHALPYLLIAVGAGLLCLMAANNFTLTGAFTHFEYSDNFSEILWNSRQPDVIGKIIALLTGAFAVEILFKERKKSL